MKKIIIIVVLLVAGVNSFAKNVKFAVDMTGIAINAAGVHIAGDFQTIAGFSGGDFAPNTTPLTQEVNDTNMYSIIVDIPAFSKYEFKFINGDQFYQAEFVPVESRVGYNFDDNRWLFVDSIANDTTFAGYIQFAQNAPAGLKLIRFLVDMSNQTTISSAGVHVAGDYQNWNPALTRLYSFGSNVYEIINYVTANNYEYKYYNGNSAGTDEVIPVLCAVNSNRGIAVTSDTVLTTFCFGSCNSCSATGITENKITETVQLFPNPMSNYSMLAFNDAEILHSVYLKDISGRVIRNYINYTGTGLKIEKEKLVPGIYFITVNNIRKNNSALKLVVE